MWSYRFPEPIVLKVTGKDAVRYAHNRLSNDIKNLAINDSRVAAALTAQGRVLALFTAFKVADDALFLVADGGDKEAIRKAFSQFIVADRVLVSEMGSDYQWWHISAPPEVTERLGAECGSTFMHPIARGGSSGFDILVASTGSEKFSQAISQSGIIPITNEQYTLERLRAGFPVFPEEINESMILTECGRSDTLMFGKGCYVGQEVIERIDAIGRLPKELKRLKLPGEAPAAGESVTGVSGTVLGRVASRAYDPIENATICFAFLKTGQVSSGDKVSVAQQEAVIV